MKIYLSIALLNSTQLVSQLSSIRQSKVNLRLISAQCDSYCQSAHHVSSFFPGIMRMTRSSDKGRLEANQTLKRLWGTVSGCISMLTLGEIRFVLNIHFCFNTTESISSENKIKTNSGHPRKPESYTP